MKPILLRDYQAQTCKLTDLLRLCKWLGIDASTDGKRTSLINWLQYEGYMEQKYLVRRMMY